MELGKFDYSITDIDLSLLNFQKAIFDIKNLGFLPIKNTLQKTIISDTDNPERLLQILKFHWQTDIKIIKVDTFALSKLINKIQIILIEQFFLKQDYESFISAYVDAILIDSLTQNASDLHVESNEFELRLRIRVHGLLRNYANLPPNITQQLLARIKIMANMNTVEHIFPQDGHINDQLNEITRIDARVASIPMISGEKIVVRFHQNDTHLALEELFLNPKQLALIKEMLIQPQGLILVTGPTGSGKTTTLYSFIKFLQNPTVNIIAIENPVERVMPDINQINIRPETGFDFSHALRAVLRLDPDIILIGEIRDYETAQITFNATETGHLILASMHSKNTNDAISRLQSLGVNKSNILSNTIAIIAQRLLRKLCEFCKITDLDDPGFFLNSQCENCIDGYIGQIPIFEILLMHKQRNSTLLLEAQHLLKLGITTKSEVLRVMGEL